MMTTRSAPHDDDQGGNADARHHDYEVDLRSQPLGPRPCSIAAALSTVGEKWSLLVVRELTYGITRFEQIVAYTGASRDMIALRLRRLEAAGVVERRPYQRAPVRYDYCLTAAGRDLYPVLLTLMEWGDNHVVDNPRLKLVHACGKHLDIAHTCVDCGGELTPENITLTTHTVPTQTVSTQEDAGHVRGTA